MASSRKYLSIKQLREREVILTEEIRLIREEIERRESSGDHSAPAWNVAVPKMVFPHQITRKEEREEEERAKFGNESNKAIMLIAKAKIEAGLTETILNEKKKKKVIAKPVIEEESSGACEVSDP